MKIQKKPFLISLAVAMVLLMIFAFADLSISIALYNPKSIFGKIMEILGEEPASLTALFCGAVLMLFHEGQTMPRKIISILGGGLVWIMGVMMFGVMPMNYIEGEPSFLAPVLMLAGAVVSIVLTAGLGSGYRLRARKAALVGVAGYVSIMVSFNVIKMLWGRMRFRAMMEPYDGFSPWFLPQGTTTNNEFMSFPSGHAAQASLILMILLLPFVFKQLESKMALLRTIAVGWIVLVTVSRVIMGAHFASDVTMGAVITICLLTFWSKLIIGKEDISHRKG